MSAARPPSAAIFGCAGKRLDDAERRLFETADPLGLILFARNIASPAQVAALVGEFRATVGRADAPVFIDQEGGRVARLRPPHWRLPPPARRFGALAARDPAAAEEAAALNGRMIAAELAPLGIDADCMPVLDLPAPGAHGIIGDRAYGDDPDTVSALGRAACDGLLKGGVLPVIKHIPGHGQARADSHLALPRVSAPLAALDARDFAPFRALSGMPAAMTAHIVYEALDAERPATTSPRVVREAIRGAIGFDGLLITDDLGMAALSGPLAGRAEAALAAGCDAVLHCSGDMDEMRAVAGAAPPLSDAAQARLARARAARRAPAPLAAAAARLNALLAA